MLSQEKDLLKQFGKCKPCYYCGASPPSSKEHAPIKSLFEAFDCDSITVPSCEKHNTRRSNDDKIIRTFLLKGLYFGLRQGTLTENQLKALERSYDSLGEAQEVTLCPLVKDPLGELDSPLSHIDRTDRIWKWMRQLTAALVWSVVGFYDSTIEWNEAIVWSPEYAIEPEEYSIEHVQRKLLKLQDIKGRLNQIVIRWWPGWSAYPKEYPPDIYRFEIGMLPDRYWVSEDRPEIVFQHRFYGTFSWYVWFVSSPGVKRTIWDALQQVSL